MAELHAGIFIQRTVEKLMPECVGQLQTFTGIISSVLIIQTIVKSSLPESAASLLCMSEHWCVTLKKLSGKTEP